MASEQKNPEEQIDALCNRCGRTFSTFLHQMEEQNAKVVCPDCATEQGQNPLANKEGHARKG
jgi:DNA-directed RNA polymerase subunit RPC12/RpoP